MSGTTKVKTYHRFFAWSLVLSFTIISMMLNGVHAVLTMRRDGDNWAAFAIAIMAVMAPLSMLLTTHLLVGLIQDWSNRRTWLVRLRGVVATVSTLIAVISFVLSFAALRDMAVLYGEMSTKLAWLVPLIIDAVILAATLAVVVAEAEMRLDREESDSQAGRATAPVESVERVPVDCQVELVDRVSEAVDRALDEPVGPPDESVGPPDESVDQFAVERSTTPADHPIDHPDELIGHSDEFNPTTPDDRGRPNSATGPEQAVHPVERTPTAPDEHADRRPIEPVEQSIESADRVSVEELVKSVDQAPDERSTRPVESDDQPVEHPVEWAPVDRSTAADQMIDRTSTESVDWVALAASIRSTTSITADAADLAQVLEMDAEGASRAEIAAAVGRAKSTVSGWIKTAAESQSSMDELPMLSAVREEVSA